MIKNYYVLHVILHRGRVVTSATSMALVAPEKWSLLSQDLGPLQSGWTRISVEYTGVCGSDFPIVTGNHPRVRFPLVMGHEMVGRVLQSEGSFSEGTLVAVNPLISCGQCRPCRHSAKHLCRSLKLRGIDARGSLTTHLDVPTSSVMPFGADVRPETAAWAEPLAVAAHAVRSAGVRPESSTMIFGAGPIGILTAVLCRRLGADVTLVEPHPQRREAASALGFSVTGPDGLEREEGHADAGIVFDCAGHPSVARQLHQVCGVQGTIVIVAVYEAEVPVNLRHIAFAEQTIRGVRVYENQDFAEAVLLISQGIPELDSIPVSIYPLAQAPAAVAEARSGSGAVKILVGSRLVTDSPSQQQQGVSA